MIDHKDVILGVLGASSAFAGSLRYLSFLGIFDCYSSISRLDAASIELPLFGLRNLVYLPSVRDRYLRNSCLLSVLVRDS